MNLFELVTTMPDNKVIKDSIVKAWHIINNPSYKKILCAISGGADSDLLIDICTKCDIDYKIDYIWYDTGLEYQATKNHLNDLEEKYNIQIIKRKAIKSIPSSCKQYGEPFISKRVSDYISRLQSYNFDFSNLSFEELYEKYPKCKAALRWWCNDFGDNSTFNINRNKWLKEFLIDSPPPFRISNKCCSYAKKGVAEQYIKENNYDLNIIGVRKDEGGVRSTAYSSCFDTKQNSYDHFRPLFWYKAFDKNNYVSHFTILHSDCYLIYGLQRTGCAGCPYGQDFEQELKIIECYEPKLYVAVNNIFKNSYEYTRKYKEFCKEMDKKYGSYSKYLKENNEIY